MIKYEPIWSNMNPYVTYEPIWSNMNLKNIFEPSGSNFWALWKWFLSPLEVIFEPSGSDIWALWKWYLSPLEVVFEPFGSDFLALSNELKMAFGWSQIDPMTPQNILGKNHFWGLTPRKWFLHTSSAPARHLLRWRERGAQIAKTLPCPLKGLREPPRWVPARKKK